VSHVSECIALYFADADVTDRQYAALIADAAARDEAEGTTPEGLLANAATRDPSDIAAAVVSNTDSIIRTLDGLSYAIDLLNRLDSQRTERLEALEHQVEGLARAIGSEVEHSRNADKWPPRRELGWCGTCDASRMFTAGKCDTCAAPLIDTEVSRDR
jgi:hypothetical protein